MDQVSAKIVELMNGKLEKVWKNQSSDLYIAIDDCKLPDGVEVNGVLSPGYVVECGWYIWDHSAATEILTLDDIEDYFGNENSKEILDAIRARAAQ